MNRIRNDFTHREIWGKPHELSDHELAKAERWWRSEVDRYPRGWAAIDHLNSVLAEKQKRGRQERIASGLDGLRDEVVRLREENEGLRQENVDLSGSINELDKSASRMSDKLTETNRRLDELSRRKR